MAKTLKLVFKLTDTQMATISLADPKDGLTKAQAETVMNDMITKNALLIQGIHPKAIQRAYIRTSEDQELA